MSEQETLPAGVHPESALLPWYANGTLSREEEQQVSRHLTSCPDCRRELDELTQLKRNLTAAYQSQTAPSPRLAKSVLARVAQDAARRRPAPSARGGLLDSLDSWFRSLFQPQWVPTLAATILAVQLGLLLWVTMPPTAPDSITTRGLPAPTTRFRVTFDGTATEAAIRSTLETIHGRIVDGPNKEGLYIIEIPAVDSPAALNSLTLLRNRPDVVRSADLEPR